MDQYTPEDWRTQQPKHCATSWKDLAYNRTTCKIFLYGDLYCYLKDSVRYPIIYSVTFHELFLHADFVLLLWKPKFSLVAVCWKYVPIIQESVFSCKLCFYSKSYLPFYLQIFVLNLWCQEFLICSSFWEHNIDIQYVGDIYVSCQKQKNPL